MHLKDEAGMKNIENFNLLCKAKLMGLFDMKAIK